SPRVRPAGAVAISGFCAEASELRLGHSGGLECLSTIGEGAPFDDPSVLDVSEPGRGLAVDHDTTRPPARAPVPEGDDAAAEVVELRRAGLEVLPVVVHVCEPQSHSLLATIDASFERGHDRHELNVGMHAGDHALCVP